jgi:hypothetical protein
MDQKLSGAKELKAFVRAFKRPDGRPITMLLLDRYILDGGGRVIGMRTVLGPISADAARGL